MEKQPGLPQHLIDKYNVSSFPILDVGGEFVTGFQPVEIERLIAKHI